MTVDWKQKRTESLVLRIESPYGLIRRQHPLINERRVVEMQP